MLIMVLLVLGIGFLQNIMNLLLDVLNIFNEPSGFVILFCEHEKSHPVWMQGEELHQWGPMVEILGLPKTGCGK